EWTIGQLTVGTGFTTTVANYGVISDYVAFNGVVKITATGNGRVLGQRTVNVQNNNVWVEFQVSEGFGLTDTTTPTLAPDLFESGAGNNTAAAAMNLGRVAPGQPFATGTEALSIDTASDQDWFRFDVAGTTARADLQVGYRYADGDIDAALYRQNPDGSLTSVASSASTSDGERITQDLSPGTYAL